jgi:hypothetical protein
MWAKDLVHERDETVQNLAETGKISGSYELRKFWTHNAKAMVKKTISQQGTLTEGDGSVQLTSLY